MLGIHGYLYRLLPANPILLRVVSAAGKRKRDLLVRCVYLGLLTAIVLVGLASSSDRYSGEVTFTALTKVSADLFWQMSYVQLALVALLAPVFTAGAITQEKDSQTYDILLATPLTNAQIILGSLLSRLFFIFALLISGIPIFSITQIFGGVAIRSIVTSFGIAIATAFVTGALAMAIATFKVGTRRTIFSFYMVIVLYLIGGILLDRVPGTHPVIGVETTSTGQAVLDKNGDPVVIRAGTSWLTGINPFLALRSIFGEPEYTPPDIGALPAELQRWPVGWYMSRPASFFITANFVLSLALVVPSALLLRRLAQSTFSPRAWLLAKITRSQQNTRRPRSVWNNPIAWREAKTKASATRATVIRYAFITAGLVGAIVLLIPFSREEPAATFVSAGSYNTSQETLLVQGARGALYKLSPTAAVTFKGEPTSRDLLHGRYKVANFTLTKVGQQNFISTIDLVDMPRRLDAETVRNYLFGLVLLEFAAILLIVTNAAASTVTREKEDGTLDLLLSTPITSRSYIGGKLRGLIAFVLPLIAVPVASVALFVVYDSFRGLRADPGFRWIVFPEAVLILPCILVIVTAFASIAGMQMSLRMRTTVRAVMASVAVVFGVCSALGFCGFQILRGFSGGELFGIALGAFSPFTVVALLMNPAWVAPRLFDAGGSDLASARMMLLFFSLAATACYAGVVYWMYLSMVKNFDMTIRKQSR
jgi:ABC-type transport system involved in multi-copper enzyme maturation permease subunit